MSPVEKWNAFAAYGDKIVALLVFVAGLTGVLFRKKLAAQQAARVASGELSSAQAHSNSKIMAGASYGLLGIGIILLTMEACAEKPIRPLVAAPLLHAIRTQELIDVAAVTDFEWDFVYIFQPYTPADDVKRKVGRVVSSRSEVADEYVLLVFVSRGQVVRFADVERRLGDFTAASGSDGIPRSAAKFKKFESADGRILLKNV